MKRRNFIITSGGILTAVGVLNKKQNQPSMALSPNGLTFPSKVEYGYRDDFEMFDSLKIDVEELTINTSNIESPEETKIKLDVKTNIKNEEIDVGDIISNEHKSNILEDGSIDLTTVEDIIITIDELTEDYVDENGDTIVTLKFILINEEEGINTEAEESFELSIFELGIKRKLYDIVRSEDVPEPGFTDGELQDNAWNIISKDEALTVEDSLI